MNCKTCDKPGQLHLVPLSTDECEFVCMPCIEERGLYCKEHDQVRVVFPEGGPVCLLCIEAAVALVHDSGELINDVIQKELEATPGIDDFNEWADICRSNNSYERQSDAVVRALLIEGARRNLTLTETVVKLRQEGSLKPLMFSFML